MNHRERALAALKRQEADVPAVQYEYTECGYIEHGKKLYDLYRMYPGDFSSVGQMPQVEAPIQYASSDTYYEVKTDDWGVEWEYRIRGRMGHTIRNPIQDESDYETYRMPALPRYVTDPAAFGELCRQVQAEKQSHISYKGGFSYLEKLTALRGFENIMMDLYDESDLLKEFMNRMTDYYLADVQKLIAAGVDAVTFGDDYGTQQSLLISPEIFRKMIMPHLERLMEPIRNAGIHIHFHSCGQISSLFPYFEELGINSIWPQLPVYDMEWLAAKCREHKFSLAIHTDRAVTMTHGTPDDVRKMVQKEYKIFEPEKNGAWFYIEVDHGFPYQNIEALIQEIYRLRGV